MDPGLKKRRKMFRRAGDGTSSIDFQGWVFTLVDKTKFGINVSLTNWRNNSMQFQKRDWCFSCYSYDQTGNFESDWINCSRARVRRLIRVLIAQRNKLAFMRAKYRKVRITHLILKTQ